MSSISSRAANSIENKKKYNGIVWENDLDLAVYDAFFRELDPQIGRWWQVDPKTEDMEQWSPYASNYDNPFTYGDPLGDEPDGDGPGDPPINATRIWGAVKAVGGLAEMVVGAVGGAATSWTGVGAVVGEAANGSKVGKVSKSASTINFQRLGNPFKNSTLKEVRNNFEKSASQGKMEKKGPNAYVNKKIRLFLQCR